MIKQDAKCAIRVLLVEDSPADAELLALYLRRGGYDPQITRIETELELKRELARGPWDLIISDYSLPGFSGMAALALARDSGLDLPFILVSGSIGEEVAVAAMRSGAHDYLLKDKLERLSPAVSRELREAEGRRERRRAEESIRFLGEASVVLSESLDSQTTLRRVARLAVPFLADWCAVDLLSECGTLLTRVAVAHVDPALEPLLPRDPRPSTFDPTSGDPMMMALRTGQAQRGRGEGGSELPVDALPEMAVPLMARGRTLGVMGFGSGAARARYRLSDLQLAEELARRAAIAIDNASLYRSAQEAIRFRDEFLTVASHELKTPLTPLELQLGTLQKNARQIAGDDSSYRVLSERLTVIQRQSWRLKRLINELLDVSSIMGDGLDLQLEAVNLSSLVREVATEMIDRGESARAGCALELRLEDTVVGRWDRPRARQVVSSLLCNALKYGSGKPVRVTLTSEGNSAVLTVADRGIGIPPEVQKRIFGRFERGVSVRHYGGLGLGLYLVRHGVDAMGGSLELTSREGEGSTFRVSLPLSGPARRFEASSQPAQVG